MGMIQGDFNEELLRNGGTFYFTGHGESDYIEIDLKKPVYARKLVIEAPNLQDKSLNYNKKKVHGASI